MTVLEEPEVRRQMRPMSVAAYHRLVDFGELDERIELIEGFLVEKMSKSPLHTFVTSALFDALLAFLDLQQHRDPSADSYDTLFTVDADELLLSVALPDFSIKLTDLLPKSVK